MRRDRPGRLERWLIQRLVPAEWRESVAGDLEEERARRLAQRRRAGLAWSLAAITIVGARLLLERRRPSIRPHITHRTSTMDSIVADLRHAARGLASQRGYAVAAVLTLALGIGANAAVFSLANWLILRPLPGVARPNELVAIGFGVSRSRGPLSVPDFTALAAGTPALAGLAGYQRFDLHIARPDGAAQRIVTDVVTGSYFDVLGSPLLAGRGFTADEGANPGAAPVAVISHRFWTQELGGARDAIGQSILVNSHPFTIVGIAARGFHGASLSGGAEMWLPIAQHALALPMYPKTMMTSRRSTVLFGLVGRLGPGQSPEVVMAQAEAVRASIAAENPTDRRFAQWRFDVQTGVESRPWVRERIGQAMGTLAGIVGLLLILTCANVGNLMLARATGRRGEIATRLALGASRFRVARLLLAESLLLSLLAGAGAIGLAWIAGAALEGTVVLQGLPPLDRAELDWRVLGYALSISTLVAIASAIAPAFSTARVNVTLALREAGRSQSASRQRVRRVLTVAQIAVAVAVLVGASLLARSVHARLSIDTGFDPSSVLAFSIEPGLQGYGPRQEALYRDLLARVREIPGVRNAGMAWLQPFSQGAADTSLRAESAAPDAWLSAETNMVSPGYFDAIGLRFVDGRDFSEAEFQRSDAKGGGVVILTHTLARRLFDDAPAVGRTVVMQYPENRVRTVVGVVADTRQRRITTDPPEMMFEPFGQSFPSGYASVLVGLSGSADAVIPAIRTAVSQLDPTLPIYDVFTLDEAVRKRFADDLLLMRLTILSAVLATVVAAVGLYGVLVRGVSERRREFGVRAALGATPRAMAALVTGEAARLLVAGVLFGVAASWWLSRFVESRLFGVSRFDAVSFAAAVTLAGVILLATSIPAARRAARVDPADMLRV